MKFAPLPRCDHEARGHAPACFACTCEWSRKLWDADAHERAASAERIAQAFHESYECLAPEHGYKTREASAKPWADVPENNRALMVATVLDLLERRVIR